MTTWMSALLALLVSAPAAAAETAPTASQIEAAHGADRLRRHRVIRAEMEIEMGGQPWFWGTVFTTVDGGRTRLEADNGSLIVCDGETVWVVGDDVDLGIARFDALAWTYSIVFPFKLRDPGARYEPAGMQPWLDGKKWPVRKLSFAPGTGDSSDDWYLVFADPETHRIFGAAYVVTFGTTLEEAEKDLHSILYEGYEKVDGAWISTRWRFRKWSRTQGVYGDSQGEGRLDAVQFVDDPRPDLFERPEGAREAPLPGR